MEGIVTAFEFPTVKIRWEHEKAYFAEYHKATRVLALAEGRGPLTEKALANLEKLLNEENDRGELWAYAWVLREGTREKYGEEL